MTRYPTTTNPRNRVSRAPERLALVLAVVFGALLLSLVLAYSAFGEPFPVAPHEATATFRLQGTVSEVISDPAGPDEVTVGDKVIACPEVGMCPASLVGSTIRVSGEAVKTPAGWVRIAREVSVIG